LGHHWRRNGKGYGETSIIFIPSPDVLLHRPVVGGFSFLGEIAGGEFAPAAVVGNAITALTFSFARIGAIAVFPVHLKAAFHKLLPKSGLNHSRDFIHNKGFAPRIWRIKAFSPRLGGIGV
jgi:hypothetical protein